MTSFFSALNPISANSNITFRATKHPYSAHILQQEIPDLTLDLVIPLLWSRNLSILDGIYETFIVFYGDHFDKDFRGFGQKGVLDFTVLPLLSRKLIADTYLTERKDSHFLNLLSWAVALPIKVITFGVALAFTIAVTPIVIGITLLRWLWNGASPPPTPPASPGAALYNDGNDDGGPGGPGGPDDPAKPTAMPLTMRTAYAALFVGLQRFEQAGIRNPNNIQRLLDEPRNLALVYAMERLTHVVDENDRLLEAQEIFDFLLEHRAFWTDLRIIANLDAIPVVNNHFVRLDQLQRFVAAPVREIAQEVNNRQSTHYASVHNSTAKSAERLEECYAYNSQFFNTEPDISIAQRVRAYDKNLVGQRTDSQILESLNNAINKVNCSLYLEPSSRVSSSALLQYCWAAVHDSTQWREGVTQETAEACFYAALYEIDREYALTDSGSDSGKSGSNQACEGGTFNKMIEGIAKIHKLCEVNFITPATAALKLPCIVRQVLKMHMAENPNVLEQIKSEGLSAVWSQIQPGVLEIMQRDFSTIYPSEVGQINSTLLELVETGEYTDLTQDIQMLEQEFRKNSASQLVGEREMMMC